MFDRLDELIERELERSRVPGLAIALVKGDEIVWSKGYGYADLATKRPVTPSTVFSIQSVTKTIIATALMQWVERGRVRLDDPANEHLAPLLIENRWQNERPVTIRHLLTHTSGLPVDLGFGPIDPEARVPLEAYIAGVAKTVCAPGEAMVYANWGYDIIGYLVGKFAGQPYDAYLREHVFAPLDMARSAITQPADVATGYYLSAVDEEYHAPGPADWPTEPARPAGAINSTVEDLANVLIALLNGGAYRGRRVLQAETVADMHELHAQCGPRASGMGLGFRVDEVAGRRLVCHGGDGVTFTTFIGAYPEDRVGVVLLINLGRAQTARSLIGHAALQTLLGEEPLARPQAQRPPDHLWSQLRGRYVSNFWGVDAVVDELDGVPALEVEGGIVSGSTVTRSQLAFDSSGVARAYDGPFHGFELAFEAGNGAPPRFYGGLYPFTFERAGDAPSPAERAIEPDAVLAGGWAGPVASPMGPVPVELTVADGRASVSVLSARDAPVEAFSAEGGRVEGHVDVSVPGLGDFRVLLRLQASHEKLLGHVYARGAFGVVPMRAELGRA